MTSLFIPYARRDCLAATHPATLAWLAKHLHSWSRAGITYHLPGTVTLASVQTALGNLRMVRK